MTLTIEDYARQFQTVKGWAAKQQAICKVAKIYHREGLIVFAALVGRPLEELEEGYALKAAFQKKNRRRRGQKPIKKPKANKVFNEYNAKQLLHWQDPDKEEKAQ